MDKKYRIKPLNHSDISQSQSKNIETQKSIIKNQNSPFKLQAKRCKSQFALSQFKTSKPLQTTIKKEFVSPPRQTFSKLSPLNHSPEFMSETRVRSKTVPQDHTPTLINEKSNQDSSQLKNKSFEHLQKFQIQKFPSYVSKSYQMIETKGKLLQLKHHIRVSSQKPVLESIQESINDDRAGFSRRMKVQLCKKGNMNLMGILEKNFNLSTDKSSPSNSRSKEKDYSLKNVSRVLKNQYFDPQLYDRHEKMQRMEEIKRKLKAVRKSNLKRFQ